MSWAPALAGGPAGAVLEAGLDAGPAFHYQASALWVRRSAEHGASRGPTSTVGVGPCAAAITAEHGGLDATSLGIRARASSVGVDAGVSIELSAGVATSRDDTSGVGSTGVFYSTDVFDLGYAVHFPLAPQERPSWMGTHHVGVRFVVPVWEAAGR